MCIIYLHLQRNQFAAFNVTANKASGHNRPGNYGCQFGFDGSSRSLSLELELMEIKQLTQVYQSRNAHPQITTDVHGITDEMVKDAPTFKPVANELRQFLESCDLGGYNSNRFDIRCWSKNFYGRA